MRIIAGIAKGMTLAVPRTGVRPTADCIREAIFSSLGERVVGACVLDLFAGTGGIGLEAASRGAASVTFVENARGALVCLEKNVETIKRYRELNCTFVVAHRSAEAQLRRFVAEDEKFSLIFADPPYGDAAQALLREEALPKLLTDEGWLVLESA